MCLHVRSTDIFWLHVKVRETRPMGRKLTCGTKLTNLSQDLQDFNPYLFFIIINWSLMQGTSLLEQIGPLSRKSIMRLFIILTWMN